MMIKRMAAIVVATALVGSLTGCALFSKGTLQYSRTTTVGQELLDLQDAKSKGALSDKEYVKAKKEILAGDPFRIDSSCKNVK